MKRRADFVDMRAVAADGLVEDISGDTKLLGPVRDVGRQLRVDDLRVVGSLGFFLVDGVRGVLFRFVMVLRQFGFSSLFFLQ